MNEHATPPPAPPASESLRPVACLELKAAALLLFTLLLIVGSGLYLLYARGVFEPTQTVILTADDSEGVVVGMDMTFSGFPIGRVRRIELASAGHARILVDVPRKDAHWLRTSSVFTLVRGLVGGANIRAYSGILSDPPLPDGAERPVLGGDVGAEVPRLLSAARDLLNNLSALSAPDAALGSSLAQIKTLTERLNGPDGALGVLLGNAADARQLLALLERSNAVLARLDALLARIDGMAARADRQLLGSDDDKDSKDALLPALRASAAQLDGLLADTRASLGRVDAVLQEAQAIGANAREATTDLGALRAQVQSNLSKLEGLINQIGRQWPFARDTELSLP
ncbi:MlaD family protein [Verminephrobacter eiseniae]|uniref:Mammalian cell entry related domain protein n=1 Tax=Verminephrobacter eiseniae (strain EF01-2) TaxID=391735 RepID=A1WFD0_VEREI|nr:MlaD family protein [Verminephrobacter eiseniae]ABM56337.1 Mammalian cell entry related domain protein [Verminephrobacter eiseniae EF01-2]MCW5286699.1 MCE family protein [Verminephrobacter eiseniae]MCW5304996.1 MCE family protein [Verminephrobacter eiseniae]MCW8182657.1 MCE family protein [Verminephrobacter eiseniae]MCW8192680.1 MCE family protein [Verminephrobacter eiseniae]